MCYRLDIGVINLEHGLLNEDEQRTAVGLRDTATACHGTRAPCATVTLVGKCLFLGIHWFIFKTPHISNLGNHTMSESHLETLMNTEDVWYSITM